MNPATKARPACATPASTRSPVASPAIAALLDHLAEELAREYIRLMEMAAEDEDATGRQQEAEER